MLFWPHILTFFAIVCLQTLPLTVLLAKCIGIAASATEEHTIAHEFWLLLWNCKVGSISNSQHHTQTPPLKSHYPPTWWFALKRIQFLVLSQQKQSWTMFLNFHWNHFLLECNEWEDQVQNFQRTRKKKKSWIFCL